MRQAVASDPDPEKVRAALDLWARALAGKLAGATAACAAPPGAVPPGAAPPRG